MDAGLQALAMPTVAATKGSGSVEMQCEMSRPMDCSSGKKGCESCEWGVATSRLAEATGAVAVRMNDMSEGRDRKLNEAGVGGQASDAPTLRGDALS